MNTSRQHGIFDSLALRLASLDEAAFDEFGHEFGPRLLGYFQRLGLSTADAESLAVTCVTEASMKAVQYVPRADGSFTGWVYKLAYHQLVDWKRENSRTRTLTTDDGLDAVAAPCCDKSDPNPGETNLGVFDAVHGAMEELSELDRKIVQLRNFGAVHTYDEISEILSITVGSARVRHLRACKKLEQILSRYPAIQCRFGLSDTNDRLHEEKQHVQ